MHFSSLQIIIFVVCVVALIIVEVIVRRRQKQARTKALEADQSRDRLYQQR